MKNTTKTLVQNQRIYFVGESLPMIVRAVSKNYAICTRLIDKIEENYLFVLQVDLGAFNSIEEAYKNSENELVYTVLDFRNNTKGTFSKPYNFRDQNIVDGLLKSLETGEVSASQRTAELNIDYDCTFET